MRLARWYGGWIPAAVAGVMLPVIAAPGLSADLAQEEREVKARKPPEVVSMVYESGKNDGRRFDLSQPASTSGVIKLDQAGLFPWALYGKGWPDLVHRIELEFEVEDEADLVLVLYFISQNGSADSRKEVKVLLNGNLLQELDLVPADAKKMPEFAIVDVPAEVGINMLILDMSKHRGWEYCTFDSVSLYEPEFEPEFEPEDAG